MYKKFLAAALAVTMVLGLAGCGGSGGSTQAASSQEKESSAAPAGSTGRGCRRTGCD
jgi:branched-chain amino acid transport system substrate-binding protein